MPLSKEVVGFFPNWLNPNIYLDLNYDSLTTIAWAFLGLQSDGSLVKQSYPPTNLINYAHSKGKRVVVSVNPGWGAPVIDNVLASASLQNTLINNLLYEIQTNEFDGVDIDFEGFPSINSISGGYNKSLFTSFIINLSNKLWNINPNYRLSIDLPPVDWNNVFDTYTLKDYVTYLMIMGYDYHWQTGPTAGAVAPLTSPSGQSVTDTLNTYLQSTPANKLLMGVPYYGYEWATQTQQPDSPTIGGGIAVTYSQALSKIQQHSRQWSSTWSCPYYTYRAGGQWYQGWYDDVESISLKYDLVKNKGIAGIGIWALGYDIPQAELSNLIINKFSTSIPPSSTYNCINNHCVEAPQGTIGIYPTLSECQTICVSPTATYNCVNNQCIEAPQGTIGTYPTLSECQTTCIVPPILTYNCVNNQCIKAPQGTTGQYSTLQECQSSCIIPPTHGVCSQNDINFFGNCIPKDTYMFATIGMILALMISR